MSSPGLRQEYQASGKALASHDYSKEQGQSKRAGAGVAVGARELSFHCLERACGAQQIVVVSRNVTAENIGRVYILACLVWNTPEQ